jgi:hypothetical protein
LLLDFVAKLNRRKHISARGVEGYCELINVWTDGRDQLHGFGRHSFVNRAMNLHARNACATIQVIDVGGALAGLLVDWRLRGERRKLSQSDQAAQPRDFAEFLHAHSLYSVRFA